MSDASESGQQGNLLGRWLADQFELLPHPEDQPISSIYHFFIFYEKNLRPQAGLDASFYKNLFKLVLQRTIRPIQTHLAELAKELSTPASKKLLSLLYHFIASCKQQQRISVIRSWHLQH